MTSYLKVLWKLFTLKKELKTGSFNNTRSNFHFQFASISNKHSYKIIFHLISETKYLPNKKYNKKYHFISFLFKINSVFLIYCYVQIFFSLFKFNILNLSIHIIKIYVIYTTKLEDVNSIYYYIWLFIFKFLNVTFS